MAIFEDDKIIMCIDQSWSTDYTIGIVGWIFSKYSSLNSVQFSSVQFS